MPQSPNQVFPAVIGGVAKPLASDNGSSLTTNITAAAAVKATPGRLVKVIILAPGTTSGALTINNCAATGAATTANQVFTLPFGAAENVAGNIFALDIPCNVGITVSAVPGAGSPRYALCFS
jgi:hypothetical protein